jgi:CheY-like chemotaxis protein
MKSGAPVASRQVKFFPQTVLPGAGNFRNGHESPPLEIWSQPFPLQVIDLQTFRPAAVHDVWHAMCSSWHWRDCDMGQCSTGGPLAGQGSASCLYAVTTSLDAALALGADEVLRGTETILFVEDQAFVTEASAEILKSAGYRVLVANSAEEASCAYDLVSGAVDLLLTDVVLPRENGRELARELRRQNPVLRVLLIAGYAEQMVKSGSESEFGRWLPKPFSAPALLRCVREMLDSRGPASARNDQRECDPFRRVCRASSLHDVPGNFQQRHDPL